ncbi:hypothetical protein MMC29_004059 [Sticta canariensis]|nr:hypothetical protein [Sticta canariensis]
MATVTSDERFFVNSDERCYSFTDTTFIKRERPLNERPINKRTGEPVMIPWLPERFQNEAAVLKIIADNTEIPVPRVKEIGQDSNGRWYLVTALVQNAVRADMVDDRCWMKQHHRVYEGPCNACIEMAQANTDQFVKETVLPWLGTLRFNSTAVNGLMLPPPWVLKYDKRSTWIPKTSTHNEFVMVHGDLGPHNIIVPAVEHNKEDKSRLRFYDLLNFCINHGRHACFRCCSYPGLLPANDAAELTSTNSTLSPSKETKLTQQKTNLSFYLGDEDNPKQVEDGLKQAQGKSTDDAVDALAQDGDTTRENTPDAVDTEKEQPGLVLAKSAFAKIWLAQNSVETMHKNFRALEGANTDNWREKVEELQKLSIALDLLGSLRDGHNAIEALLSHYHDEEEAAKRDAEACENGDEGKKEGQENKAEPKSLGTRSSNE